MSEFGGNLVFTASRQEQSGLHRETKTDKRVMMLIGKWDFPGSSLPGLRGLQLVGSGHLGPGKVNREGSFSRALFPAGFCYGVLVALKPQCFQVLLSGVFFTARILSCIMAGTTSYSKGSLAKRLQECLILHTSAIPIHIFSFLDAHVQYLHTHVHEGQILPQEIAIQLFQNSAVSNIL